MPGNAGLCRGRKRILGASVVHYSTGEPPLGRKGANELLSGRVPGFTSTYWGNKVKLLSVVLQALQFLQLD